MGSKAEKGHGSENQRKAVEAYTAKIRRRAKTFIAINELAQLLGIENESDVAKRNLYLRLLRGSVTQYLLSMEANGKHPVVTDQALAAQISRNEDLQHSHLGRVVLCDISLAIGDLFSLLKRNSVPVEKNMAPIDEKIIRAWEVSSLLPVIESVEAVS